MGAYKPTTDCDKECFSASYIAIHFQHNMHNIDRNKDGAGVSNYVMDKVDLVYSKSGHVNSKKSKTQCVYELSTITGHRIYAETTKFNVDCSTSRGTLLI